MKPRAVTGVDTRGPVHEHRERMFPPPHQQIVPVSGRGSPLILRLRSASSAGRGHLWLRVHESGDLEQAVGDARSDDTVRPIAALGPTDPRIVAGLAIREVLRARLRPCDLTERSPWDHYFPVQAFAREEPVIEGFIGVESDMGARTDIFGLDGNWASMSRVVDGIHELLGFVRR